jgi:hypothetical protein
VKTRRAYAALLLGSLTLAAGCSRRVTTIGVWEPDAVPEADAMPASLGRYIEAESGALTGSFAIRDDGAASGGRFISPEVGASSEDAAGPAQARYELTARLEGTYFVWGRIQSQNISENRLWVQVDDGDWYKWRITTGDIWYWDAFHDNVNYGTPIEFHLSAGTHPLVIANCVDGVGLDRIYYAPDHSRPTGDDTACNPPHSIELAGRCDPSCGSLAGHCGGTPCDGVPTFATYDCDGCCIPQGP